MHGINAQKILLTLWRYDTIQLFYRNIIHLHVKSHSNPLLTYFHCIPSGSINYDNNVLAEVKINK